MDLNFSNICRLCMVTNESLLPLFDQDARGLPLRIMTLLPKVQLCVGDGLPAQVCHHCVHQIDTSYNFKLQCEKSDSALRKYLLEKESSHNSEQGKLSERCDIDVIEDNKEDNWGRSVLLKVELEESAVEECAFKKTTKSDFSARRLNKRSYSRKSKFNAVAESSITDSNDVKKEDLSGDNSDGMDMNDQVKPRMCKKKYICQDCGKTFPQKSNLIAHTRTHTGEKPFSCSKCSKCFGRRSTLQDHMKTHTGEKPFLCEECGKHFSRSSHLKVHLKVHSGERPFSCHECGKSFIHGCHLKDHLVTHSKDKPFCCTECGKCFSSSSIFKRHLLRHSGEKPFVCVECGKRFSGSSDLYIHTRTHTGDKRYCCSECGKRFLLGCHLKDHMKIHSGEKPFSCVECGKCFARKQVLNKHSKSHH